jgi:hypothetical protein
MIDIKTSDSWPVTHESIQELIDVILEEQKKIRDLMDQVDELQEKNDEITQDICDEQDYNVMLWSIIAKIKGYK